MRNNMSLMKLLNYIFLLRLERLLPYVNLSFSQEGEDLILKRIFEKKKKGIYVDVGAHHPIRFSNTYLFYRLGWRGINIDACPGSMRLFDSLRPGDTNIESAIGGERKQLEYYIFDEPALNSFDYDLSMGRHQSTSYRIKDTKLISMVPLSEILGKTSVDKKEIDFMSIDVEGLEFDVLSSNDWNRFAPKVLLVEYLAQSFNEIVKSEVHLFMSSLKYILISKTANTLIYHNDRA